METITSTANAGVKYAASLADARTRKNERKFVVEGEVMLREALRLGMRPDSVWIREGYETALFDLSGFSVRTVTDTVFKKLCDTVTPQGVLAVFSQPDYALTEPEGDCLILDGVRDPGNFGTIVRTAAACGIKDIYAIDCVDAYGPKAVRATMTGIFFVRIHACTYADIAAKVAPYAELWVADMGGENLFETAPAPNRVGIVIGNEAHGVRAELRTMAQRIVALPMQNIESLNAAVSASVILYELKQHLRNK